MSFPADPQVWEVFGDPPPGIDLGEDPRGYNVVTSILFLVIAYLAVILRFTARKIQNHQLMADDYILLISLAFASAIVGISLSLLTYGNGLHMWRLSANDTVMSRKLTFPYVMVWIAAVSLTKTSILLLYRRLFSTAERWFFVCIYVLGAMLCILPTVITVIMLSSYRPLSTYWEVFERPAVKLMDTGELTLGMVSANVALDIAVLILPVPQILKLKLSPRKRLGVVGLMLLGSFVCVIGIMHIYYLSSPANNQDPDDSWFRGKVFLWSAMEPSVGILSACLPHMRPVYIAIRDRVLPNSDSSRRRRMGNGLKWERRGYGPFPTLSRGSGGNTSARSQGDEDDLDKIRLTNVVIGGTSNESIHGDGIIVRSEVRQSYSNMCR